MSTETKWTKGPWCILGKRSIWRAEPKGCGINATYSQMSVAAADGREIALVVEIGDLEQKYDAHLIASAPALYAALAEMVDRFDPHGRDITFAAARTALASARGEG